MPKNFHVVVNSILYLITTHNIATADDQWLSNNLDLGDDWQGHWFPYAPGTLKDDNPIGYIKKELFDAKHAVKMGIPDPDCDDGKTNLIIDWNYDSINFTCYDPRERKNYRPRSDIHPIEIEEHIPKGYVAQHKCMDQPIEYDKIIPTFGTHRPLWAEYGEYTFLPRQRWLHNLEHGAVVMLYHPCADENDVHLLKQIVTNCLYRHIITPYNLLPPEHPLALVTWGHLLQMSHLSPDIILNFIKQHALKGPEQTSKDGQYEEMIKEHAIVVSDINDSQICKPFNYVQ